MSAQHSSNTILAGSLVLFALIVSVALSVFLLVLIIKALLKYLRSGEQRAESTAIRQSLGEKLRQHRQRCQMTQEFVAETLGVSRQAVSKWENGASDPSTTNLVALGRLYGVAPEELLRQEEV